jgi:hypothetical protein
VYFLQARWYKPCALAACKQHPQTIANSGNKTLCTIGFKGKC